MDLKEKSPASVGACRALFYFSRGGRIRTGDPLNPIRLPDGLNHGKKQCKSLVGRTICYSCREPMLTSAALNRHINRPNRHTNRPKDANRRPLSCKATSQEARSGEPRIVSRFLLPGPPPFSPFPPPFATLRDTFQTQGGVGSVRPDSAGLRASHSFCCPRPTQARNSGRAEQWIARCGWVPRRGD